jgi:glucose/arabinose dehydrogenase
VHLRSTRIACLLAATSVLIALAAPAAAGATTLPAGFAEETLSSGMSGPTAMAFAPDGRTFVTEKAGRVRVVRADGTLVSTPLLDIRDRVNHYSDRGMMGIAVDKDFATNGFVYILYVYELSPLISDQSGPMVSRLTRIKVNPDNTLANPTAPETPILGSDVSSPCPDPNNARDCMPADFYWHVVGTVRVDPADGTLWVGSGDNHNHAIDAYSYRPYDEQSFAGKIIHIDRNGNGLPGHPFCPSDTNLTHTCTKLYAKGFRNPFRFSLRPGKGPVVGDVGASDREEVDLIRPGQNYGWPCYEGDIRTPLYDQESRCAQEYAKEGTTAAATPPDWSYDHGDGASVMAGPVYQGTSYPSDHRGDVFVGDYVQGWVKRLEVNANDDVTGVNDFATGWPTGVDLQAMPGSGDIAYVDLGWGASPGAAIRRFRFTGDTNTAPAAVAQASPTSGTAPLLVRFTGTGSTDPDNDALSYRWDFGDGTSSTQANLTHSYAQNGQYTATLTVNDGRGHTDTDSVQITVGNRAPVATIAAPADESTFRAGQPVQLNGSATDPEDGSLTGGSLQWHVFLHHATHVHDHSTASGAQASFTPVTDHDADSYYEVRLTATDSRGLSHTRTIELRPETKKLTLASSPAGAPIEYADSPAQAAPFTKTAAVGYKPTVVAADSFVRNGVTYRFQGWSDGGARQHQASIPATDSQLTATYAPENADRFTFTPEADAYVDSSTPTTSTATSTNLRVDTTPASQSFLRFRLRGLAGRTVRAVRLRMFQKDASNLGGRVFSVGSNSWSESITWASKPAIDGPQRGSFGATPLQHWYEAELTPQTVSGDGSLSLALDSTSSDGSVWASRDELREPELIVEVAKNGGVTDGLSEVAGTRAASSNPTYYAGNHRLARTAGGRLLTVFGRQAEGVQLAWRDPGGGWRRTTRGAAGDGLLLRGTGSGDWPASIATATDSNGKEHAWVVFSRSSPSSGNPVRMVRLDELDSIGGPKVGPTMTVDAPALGAYRADLGFERAPDGSNRGVIVWSRQTSSTNFEIVTGWFSALSSPTQAIHNVTVLTASTSSTRFGSVVRAPGGTRILARGSGSAFRVWSHPATALLGSWTPDTAAGVPLSSSASPAGVALSSGELLAAAETDTTNHVVSVQRFSATGAPRQVELSLTGYEQPTLATDGTRAWLVMVRSSDRRIVSRQLTGATWSTADRLEIGPEGGGNHAWPNVLSATDGRLRLVVRGPSGSSSRTSVLAFQRGL